MMPATLSSQKRDHFIWTDLIFRIPPHRPQSKVPKKAAKCHTPAVVTSNLHPCGSSCQMGKKARQMKPSTLHMDSVPEEETEKANVPPSPPPHPMNPPPPPGNPASQEKHKVKRILVDLTSILENVMDPSEEGPEDGDLQNDAQPPSDPGGFSSKILDHSEEAEETDLTNDGCSSSNAGDPSSEHHKTETTTADSEDGQADQDILVPLSVDWCRDFSLAADTDKTTKGILSPPDEPILLWRTSLPVAQPSQPNLRTPTLFHEINVQQQGLPETDGTADLVRPAAPSPDFQLPTQLLLQRLQETTTSKNHLLIMQVLRSLREELLAQSSDSDGGGDKRHPLAELPMGNPQKHRKPQARARKPVAPKTRLGKLIWCSRKTVHAADSGQKASKL